MLMIITRIEWVYRVELVEHLQEKDVDVAMKDVELQEDADPRVPDVDQEALQDATALDADMSQPLDLELDTGVAIDHHLLDAEVHLLDVEVHPLDTLDVEVRHPDVET